MAKDTWRVVTRGADGELYIHDFDSPEHIIRSHLRIGSDDCSTDLDLRGGSYLSITDWPHARGIQHCAIRDA